MQQSVQIIPDTQAISEKEIEVDRSNCDAEHLQNRHECKLDLHCNHYLKDI